MKSNKSQRPPVTSITFLDDKKTVHIVTNDDRLINRIGCAQKKYPADVIVDSVGENCMSYQIPQKWLVIRPPQVLTSEERQKRRERARLMGKRHSKKDVEKGG